MESKNNTKKVSDVAERGDLKLFPTKRREPDRIVVEVVKQEEKKRRKEEGSWMGIITIGIVSVVVVYIITVALFTYGGRW